MGLDERKFLILQAIIDDYITTAMPVGSRTISRKAGVGFSPATIRNEMSDLEELGYLAQPHTSAGRVPSYKAYRLYVDKLLKAGQLSGEERQKIAQHMQTRSRQVETVIRRAARVLSDATKYTSVVVAPHIGSLRIRHVQIVPVSSGTAMLIIVTSAGIVKDAVINIPEGLSADHLYGISRMLTERLEQQARTDALTGLLNRAGLEEDIRLRLEGAPQQSCAIVLLDIDDFKDINDFYGHDVGDDVLRTLAEFLRGHFRGTDIVGRLGGDEFMALMEGVDSREKLRQALLRLKSGLSRLHAGEVRVGCSAGAVLFPTDGDSFDALYKGADVALYDAKRAGKGRFTVYDGDDGRFFTPQMLEHADYIAYAVDPETRELLFANARMCARFPTLRPGEKCYHALMAGADAPCEGCDTCALLKAALDGSEDGSGALCSEWLRAAPTAVRWNDGREVLLFSCKPAEAAGAASASPAACRW